MGQDKLIRHLWKDCLPYRTKNTSKLTINANFVSNTVNHASLAIKRLLWLSVFTTLEPPYWMFSRISEVGPNQKLVPSTPRLSFWTVWFRHNPIKWIRSNSEIAIPPKRAQSPPKITKSRRRRYLTLYPVKKSYVLQDFRKLGMGMEIIVKGVFWSIVTIGFALPSTNRGNKR